jgi:EAL domain-containing protein (putative c-di-GMP-specific phosphodiesterase class I)
VHRAIEERRILPLFQRIVRLEDESTHGVECLARIVDKNEVLEPSEFIAAASATGTMPAITREMVSRVFEVMHHHSIEFSLNVSEFDLEEHYLLDYLLAQAGRFEVKPERVTLELLETISSSRRSAHIAQLLELKKAGFKLAIDDFGAEYSSFSRILELDVDYLKIDAKFVTRVHMDDRCREIIKAIVYFCRNAGILSVAEHVDSVEIANELRAIGVDFAQGFLFAQPQRSPE